MQLINSRLEMDIDSEGRIRSLGSANGERRTPIDEAALTGAFMIALRDAQGKIIEVTPQAPPTMERQDRDGAQALNLTWQVGGEWGEMTVRGRVELPEGSAMSAWTLAIENRTPHALWQINYPRVSGLTAFSGDGSEDYLAAPVNLGHLCTNPIRHANRNRDKIGPDLREEYGTLGWQGDPNHIAFDYPGMWTVQFMAFGLRGNGGTYFAAHDGDALYKQFGMYGDAGDGRHAALVMKQYPEDRTAPGADFASFYPVMIGVYDGEWWDASKLYRPWALRQVWCRKGPVKDREDVPTWAKQHNLWYWNWQFVQTPSNHPEEHLAIVEHFKKRFGCDVAFHWYGCNGEGTITGIWRGPDIYPDNSTIRRTLTEAVQRFHEMGARCFPYINPRLWVEADDDFIAIDGKKWIAVDENGKSADAWAEGLHTMCPTAKPTHEVMRRIVNRMIDEIGMDGAYLDQISACNAVPCFNPAHDHGPGGHDHWSRGNRELLEKLQKDAKARSPEIAFTSESTIECYLDLLDLDLAREITSALDWFGDDQMMPIPMFHTVYHDYHMTYGTRGTIRPARGRQPEEFEWFRCGEALALVGGGQLMISGAQKGDEDRPGIQPYYEYMNTLIRARMAATRFLNLGVWKPPLALECARVDVMVQKGKPPKRNVPAVLNGCFELEGELCVALVNHTAAEQAVALTLDPAAYELGRGPLRLSAIHPEEEVAAEGVTGPVRYQTTMPPASAKILRLA
ncbi:MAG: hypothetical protein HY321_01035 [Armatimonadetes bacterium]|nr:hypothetical protein [Armatimonadota bacterium]